MKIYGIRDLRNNTAEVIAEAARDGEVAISRRGEIVARLVTVRESTPIDEFTAWIEGLEVVDTGWADEFLADKHRELAETDSKPWE